MIDLHIHSTYSDGSLTVKELLQEAQNKQLEIISITDHDKVEAYGELSNLDIKQYFSGKIIPGCEFKCYFQEYKLPIEILGYGIDVEKIKKEINQKKITEIQNRYLQHLKEVGNKIGLKFNQDVEINDNAFGYASTVFEAEILKYPENISILEKNKIDLNPNFYRCAQCNKESIFYIDEEQDFIKVDELIEKIHNANGLAFLAHSYIYKIENVEKMVEDLIKKYRIDGIECYYSTFSEEQTEKMKALCGKYKIFCSGGSDFHGVSKPDIQMGTGKGQLKVENEYIEDWIQKINNIID